MRTQFTTAPLSILTVALFCACAPRTAQAPSAASTPTTTAVPAAPAEGRTPPQTTYGLAIVNARGDLRPLANLPAGWFYADPALSPDGNRIVVAVHPPGAGFPVRVPVTATGAQLQRPTSQPTTGDLMVYDLRTAQYRTLENAGREILPVWLPDGVNISFVKTVGLDSAAGLFIQRADGSEPARQILSTKTGMAAVSWFPDGSRAIVANNRIPRDGRLTVVPVAIPEAVQAILAEPFVHNYPVVSPDGKLLAFTYSEPTLTSSGSSSTGTRHIAVYRFADGARVSPAPSIGTNPIWSSNGRTLFFQSTAGAIYKAAVRDSAILAIDRPQLATSFQTYASLSRFAPLPGDTTFVVRTVDTVVKIVAPIPPALLGRRANDRDQRALELVAAREVLLLAAQLNRGFDKLALDARAYRMSSDPPFAGFADSAKSYLLPAHTSAHMKELAQILRVAGTVSDSAGICVAIRPTGCRMGPFPGLVAMSPAIISADSAMVSIARTERATGTITGASTSYTLMVWHVTMMRQGGQGWVVKRVVRFP